MAQHADVPLIEVDLGDGVRAAFTAAPLNLGLHVGDDPGRVRENRRLVERWLGGPVAFATQVHGADVAVVVPQTGSVPDSVGAADAIVTSGPTGVGVMVADCVPVLLADADAGVVAAVHAGRRGLAGGVVQAALRSMVAAGAAPERVRAAIGPAICGACYEVPAAMRDEIAAVVPAARSTTSWGTPALDLPRGVEAVLAGAGVRHVRRLDCCTATDERFFSHRRSVATGATDGRSAGVVRRTRGEPGVSEGIGEGPLLA
ncbi:peptidoglycan editing factor PgeF [Cellulomonas fimi]|uniref:Purine nucleoside phosphorylase n=1 Tax=Cellulomonas fimi TaxID=1708 RepID=A0A7Y0LYM9_CELFI|nr:peptidoglycan editing factor PgeF [Cellulomonas fimi]